MKTRTSGVAGLLLIVFSFVLWSGFSVSHWGILAMATVGGSWLGSALTAHRVDCIIAGKVNKVREY